MFGGESSCAKLIKFFKVLQGILATHRIGINLILKIALSNQIIIFVINITLCLTIFYLTESLKPMHIRLEQISEEGVVIEFEEPSANFAVLADMVNEGQCEFLAPVGAGLRAQRFGDIVEIEGRIKTSVRLACGRCLQKFENQLESRFVLTYKKGMSDEEAEASKQEEIELKHEDINLIYYQG